MVNDQQFDSDLYLQGAQGWIVVILRNSSLS